MMCSQWSVLLEFVQPTRYSQASSLTQAWAGLVGCGFRFWGASAVWDRGRALLGSEYRPQPPLAHFSDL
jgi:hypothetical protein